jgi:CheY-like chemotaxis protein
MSDQPLILVVEDSDDHVLLLRHAFQKAGIKNPIQVVSTGEEAIEYLDGTGRYSNWDIFRLPAVVLLDLKLPGIDGFGVLRWVRQQAGLKGLIVIMLTSSDLMQETNHAYELGVNAFLVKPVDLGKLIEMMRAFRDFCLIAVKAPHISRINRSQAQPGP